MCLLCVEELEAGYNQDRGLFPEMALGRFSACLIAGEGQKKEKRKCTLITKIVNGEFPQMSTDIRNDPIHTTLED